ncbi:MAG: glycosyltransferase family 2 protein [Methyloceanibacter sp.]
MPGSGVECETSTRSPKVSICLITYNGASTIERALNSLLAQTYRDFELVISDDHSSDESLALCQRLTTGDPRVRFVRPPHNLGADYNMRFALSHARGKYYLWASQDDYWEPQFLERLVPALEHNPKAVCAMGCVRHITSDGSKPPLVVHYAGRDLPEGQSRLKLAISILAGISWEGMPLTKNNLYIYGLMDRENYAAAVKAHARPIMPDRQIVCHLALTGDFVYVDEVLFHKTRHVVELEDRRPATDATVIARRNHTLWRNVSGTSAGILRSPVIPLFTKVWAVPSLFLAFWWYNLVVRDGPRQTVMKRLRRWTTATKRQAVNPLLQLPHKTLVRGSSSYRRLRGRLLRLPGKALVRGSNVYRRLRGRVRKPLSRGARRVKRRAVKPLLRLPSRLRRRGTSLFRRLLELVQHQARKITVSVGREHFGSNRQSGFQEGRQDVRSRGLRKGQATEGGSSSEGS